MRPYPSAGIVGAIERAGFLIQGIGFLLEAREIDCLRIIAERRVGESFLVKEWDKVRNKAWVDTAHTSLSIR